MRKSALLFVAAALVLSVSLGVLAQEKKAEKATVIELVQTPGQFEPQKLELKAGPYVFKVVNKNVEHEVGFYLRKKTADGKGKPLPNSDAGHLKAGQSGTTGVVELEPGEYIYSCPLNPTPHYVITVK